MELNINTVLLVLIVLINFFNMFINWNWFLMC